MPLFWNVPLDGGEPWPTTLKQESAERRYPVARPRHTCAARSAAEALAVHRFAAADRTIFSHHGNVPVASMPAQMES